MKLTCGVESKSSSLRTRILASYVNGGPVWVTVSMLKSLFVLPVKTLYVSVPERVDDYTTKHQSYIQ